MKLSYKTKGENSMEKTYANKMKDLCVKTKESFIKGVDKIESKTYAAVSVGILALSPTATFAAGKEPAGVANDIADGILGQILKVAPKLAIAVIAWCVLLYLCSGNEHKKNQH